MLAEKNVTFYMNDGVMEVRGQGGKVKEVVLKSAKVLPADVFIVGIGGSALQLLIVAFMFAFMGSFMYLCCITRCQTEFRVPAWQQNTAGLQKLCDSGQG